MTDNDAQFDSPRSFADGVPPETKRLGTAALGAVLVLVAVLAGFVVTFSRGAPQEPLPAAAAAADPFANAAILARAGIVIDLLTGKVLYEKNPTAQLPLASLTKVALALVVSEVMPLDERVVIPHYIGGANGESLLKGERWRLGDVLDFTLAASSNDGAEYLASLADEEIRARYPDAPAGSATLWRMNELVRTLGLTETYFLNVSGLDLSASQASAYGSARDMAALFAYAASANPSLFASTAHGNLTLVTPEGTAKAVGNTNLTQGAVPGLIIGKTGFTDLAGGNLAIVFDRGLAHPLVAVVLGSTEQGRFDDMQSLVSRARLVTGGGAGD